MMRTFVFITTLSIACIASSCNKSNTTEAISADSLAELKTTKIQFEDSLYSFGTINEGDTVRHEFVFKNTGNEPLLIADAKGSCGCTTPQYTKDTIAPGETGKMMVQFNSNGRSGEQQKTVTVLANTDPEATVVTIQGFVKKKPEVIDGPFIKK
jgi:hypothetical protein